MVVRSRKAFTIVEMLAVIGIIAVLATIIVSAIKGSISSSRDKRAEVMRASLEQALAAYYAQEGRWPDTIERADTSKTGDNKDKEDIRFEGKAADKIFQDVVGKGFGRNGKKSMLIDASGLFVCDSTSAGLKRPLGFDFSDASKRHSKHYIDIDHMAFGFQGKKTGLFRRFYVVYHFRTDSITVGPIPKEISENSIYH